MDLNQYQREALMTAVYPLDRDLEYTVLGLCSEAGELAGKLKKVIRDNDGDLSSEHVRQMRDEAGDVLWYVAAVCDALGTTLGSVAVRNLDKLNDRKKRNVLQGSGDYR